VELKSYCVARFHHIGLEYGIIMLKTETCMAHFGCYFGDFALQTHVCEYTDSSLLLNHNLCGRKMGQTCGLFVRARA